jgi:outer membrane protein OmpA-like peptidoglycan-associated protein
MAKDKPYAEVDHEAYLAVRYARAAQQHGSLIAANASLATQDSRRNAVLLQARTRDARVAMVVADAATAAASDARDSAALASARADMADAQLVALQAQQTERGIVVTLGDVLFSTGKSELRESSQHSIGALVGFLNSHPERTVRVEGYTDSVGSDEYNRGLSDRRAASVTDALERGGISASRIQAEGFGNTRPVASNDSADGRRQNRRVEIVISQPVNNTLVGRQSPP